MSSDGREPRDLLWLVLTAVVTVLATEVVGSLPRWPMGLLIFLLMLFLTPRRYLDRYRKAVSLICASAWHPVARSGGNATTSSQVRERRRRFWRRIAVVTGGLTMLITIITIARPLVLDKDQQVWPADPTVVACYEDLDRSAKAAVLKTARVSEPGGAIAACRAEWRAAFGHIAPDHLVNCVLAEGGQAVFPGRGIRAPEEVCEVVNAKPFA